MAALKTRPTDVSPGAYIAAIRDDKQRSDAWALVSLMQRLTGQEPRMWGPSIIGFGSYRYTYRSGHQGESALAAFAVRGRELVVYISESFEGRDALLARLGPHKLGKVCLYMKRLGDVDMGALESLVARSIEETERLYPTPAGEAD
jgi:hypothetical protein